jgi:hypothetical protein
MAEFHGWRHPDLGAVYIAVDPATDLPTFYALTVFVNTGTAERLQHWLDETLSVSGQVNAELLDRLAVAEQGGDEWRL